VLSRFFHNVGAVSFSFESGSGWLDVASLVCAISILYLLKKRDK
jgi:uncharacterized membrane protein